VTHSSVVPSISAAPIEAAASRLATARRVLVTGFVDAPLEIVAAACDVAELLGAAVDAGSAEASRPAGPTIARVGEVTAAREEMRDRADLVVFWFCDPDAVQPRFTGQFITPAPSPPLARRTMSIGPVPVHRQSTGHRHLPLDRSAAVDAARSIHLMLLSGGPPTLEGALAQTCDALHAAIATASCVAFVTDDAADPIGLEAWSLVHLIRAIAHQKPAFELPLGSHDTATAAALCTWRYGAAGAIARADRAGADFLPGEASAQSLIARGEVDCVLAVGRLAAPVAQAIAARGDALTVIHVDEPTAASMAAHLASLRAAVASRLEAPAGRGLS